MICLDGNFKSDQLDKFSAFNVDDKIVFACEWVDNANYPSIRSDNEKGAKLAFRHLYDLGHRKIAHVTGPENNVLTLIRRDSLNHERERLGLPLQSRMDNQGRLFGCFRSGSRTPNFGHARSSHSCILRI